VEKENRTLKTFLSSFFLPNFRRAIIAKLPTIAGTKNRSAFPSPALAAPAVPDPSPATKTDAWTSSPERVMIRARRDASNMTDRTGMKKRTDLFILRIENRTRVDGPLRL
jgi:hypothetical protein